MFFQKCDLLESLQSFFPYEISLNPVVDIISNELTSSLESPITSLGLKSSSFSNVSANTILNPLVISGQFTIIGFPVLPTIVTIVSVGTHQSVSTFRDNGYTVPFSDGVNLVAAGAVTTQGNYIYLGLLTAGNSSTYHCFVIPSGMSIYASTIPAINQSGNYTFVKPAGSFAQPSAYNLSLFYRNFYGTVSCSSVSGSNLFFSALNGKRANNFQVLHTLAQNSYNSVLFNAVCFNSSSLHNVLNFSGYEIVPFTTRSFNIPPTTFTSLP
jgi:hypothetical protein